MAAASYEDASTSNNPNLSAIKARRIQEIDRFLANINYLISSPADMNNAAQAQSVIQNIKRWATVNLKWYHKLYDLFFLTGRESAEEVQFNFLNPVREALERLQNMDLDAQLRENPSFIQDQIQIIVDTTRQYRQRLNEPDQQIWFDIIEDPPDIDVIEATPDNAKPLFTVHQEACRNLHRDILQIKTLGGRAGVALAPATNIDVLEYIIEDLDLLILLTVNPGYKGQPLIPQVLSKVEKARSLIEKYNTKTILSVDGNVDFENIPKMVGAGANMLVLGSS